MNQTRHPDKFTSQHLPQSIAPASWIFYAAALVLGAVVLAAILAFGKQLREGLGVSGKNRPIMWSFYVTDFIFWSGIGHACILATAWMRLRKTPWRHAISRCGDVLAFAALTAGSLFPIIHLGRPRHFYWLIPFPNTRLLYPSLHSPLVWDFVGMNTLLALAFIYIYLHLLPDLALIRDSSNGLRRGIARLCALGWKGVGARARLLENGRSLMTVMVLPAALAANVTQFLIFAGTPNLVWHGLTTWPHFFLTSLFSGIAALALFGSVLQGSLSLQEGIGRKALDRLGKILWWLSCLWLCLTAWEALRLWHRGDSSGMAVLNSKLRGEYAPIFWAMIICCFAIPLILLGIRRMRTAAATSAAACAILIGLWLDRFLFIVPTLAHPRLAAAAVYSPTAVEIIISAGAAAGFLLVCLVSMRSVPMISVWELNRRE